MSVRRLAEDSVQPPAFAFNRANASWAKKKLKDFPEGREASGVIPLLMRAQEQEGWVTRAAIEHVAEMLDMPLIRVLEVATFYTQFQLAPVGTKAHVQVCGTTPCMLRGAGDLIETCKRVIGPKPFETSADGKLSWEEVECQGACVNAPMVMIFKDTYEDLTPKQLEDIIYRFEVGNGKSVTPGPQIDRIYSAPEGGLTSLQSVPKSTPSKSGGARSKPQAATKAARPASGVDVISPAIKTPIGRKASKTALMREKKARKVAGTPSPRKRAEAEKTVKPAMSTKPKVAASKAALRKPVDKNRPVGVKKPKKPDDLKMISGVGPKLEKDLNKLGIWQFDQIAKLKKAEREWVGTHFGFSGRIEREDWVKQAKALAKGGAEEYIRVFGKKPR